MHCIDVKVYVVMLLGVEWYTRVSPVVLCRSMFRPSRLSSGRRAIVLHRLMDREALKFGGSESILSSLDDWGLRDANYAPLMTWRGHGYRLRFRPSGVSDWIIFVQRLSFSFRYCKLFNIGAPQKLWSQRAPSLEQEKLRKGPEGASIGVSPSVTY